MEARIAQSVEQWSRNPVTRVRNQGDALVPFGKALILITTSGCLLTSIYAFLAVR